MKYVKFFAGLLSLAYLPIALPFLFLNDIAHPRRSRPPVVTPRRPTVHVRYHYDVRPQPVRCGTTPSSYQVSSAQQLPNNFP